MVLVARTQISIKECCLCDFSIAEEWTGAIILLSWSSPCSLHLIVSGAGLDLPVSSSCLVRWQRGLRMESHYISYCHGDVMLCWLCPNTLLSWKSAVGTFRWVLIIEKRFILIYGIKIEFWLWVTIKYYLAPLFGKMLRCMHKWNVLFFYTLLVKKIAL